MYNFKHFISIFYCMAASGLLFGFLGMISFVKEPNHGWARGFFGSIIGYFAYIFLYYFFKRRYQNGNRINNRTN